MARVGGKTHFEDVSIGIINDRALPKLLEAAVKGELFNKVQIHGAATVGKDEQNYLEITLENSQITSFQLGVLDNNLATDDMLLSLNFEKLKSLFRDLGNAGGAANFEWKVE